MVLAFDSPRALATFGGAEVASLMQWPNGYSTPSANWQSENQEEYQGYEWVSCPFGDEPNDLSASKQPIPHQNNRTIADTCWDSPFYQTERNGRACWAAREAINEDDGPWDCGHETDVSVTDEPVDMSTLESLNKGRLLPCTLPRPSSPSGLFRGEEGSPSLFPSCHRDSNRQLQEDIRRHFHARSPSPFYDTTYSRSFTPPQQRKKSTLLSPRLRSRLCPPPPQSLSTSPLSDPYHSPSESGAKNYVRGRCFTRPGMRSYKTAGYCMGDSVGHQSHPWSRAATAGSSGHCLSFPPSSRSEGSDEKSTRSERKCLDLRAVGDQGKICRSSIVPTNARNYPHSPPNVLPPCACSRQMVKTGGKSRIRGRREGKDANELKKDFSVVKRVGGGYRDCRRAEERRRGARRVKATTTECVEASTMTPFETFRNKGTQTPSDQSPLSTPNVSPTHRLSQSRAQQVSFGESGFSPRSRDRRWSPPPSFPSPAPAEDTSPAVSRRPCPVASRGAVPTVSLEIEARRSPPSLPVRQSIPPLVSPLRRLSPRPGMLDGLSAKAMAPVALSDVPPAGLPTNCSRS